MNRGLRHLGWLAAGFMAAVAVACSGMGEPADRSRAHRRDSNSSFNRQSLRRLGRPQPQHTRLRGPNTDFRDGLRLH